MGEVFGGKLRAGLVGVRVGVVARAFAWTASEAACVWGAIGRRASREGRFRLRAGFGDFCVMSARRLGDFGGEFGLAWLFPGAVKQLTPDGPGSSIFMISYLAR